MVKASIVNILLFILLSISVLAQSPQINCVSVAANGNVTINWTPSPVVMQTSFVQYNVYSDASGSFAQEGSVSNFNSTVFVHSGANANVNSVNYYITIVYDNGSTNVELPPLDTLSTIFLDVNNPSDGTAILQWSDLDNPIDPNNGSYYYIQTQMNGGAWMLLDSVLISDLNYYRDTISICSANINYQVYLNNSQGCQSLSNIDGDLFQDLIPPASPVMSSVTVDSTTGDALLTWYPSTSMDASAYIIMQNVSGVWSIIDTVYGYSDTTYLNTNSNADLISEMYGVAAFDSCWNGNPPAPNTSPLGTPHVSMYAKTNYSVCDHEVKLKWNSYRNWNGGVQQYNVYSSTEGGPYSLLSTISNGDTTYTELLNYGVHYCYVVEAISSNGMDTAISNITCRYARQPNSPHYAYIQTVTIEDDLVTIKIHPDETGTTKEIELFRSKDGVDFQSIYLEHSLSNTIIYQDEDVDPNEDSYWYEYTVRDSCENVILTSNVSRNIYLTVTPNQNSMTNFIQWNSYKNWNGNLMSYELYRSVNGVYDPSPIATLSPSQLFYEDDITNFIGSDADGEFCYYVKAIESNNVYGIQETSFSNEACTVQNSLVYIPNAFVIGGHSAEWMPVLNLFDYSSYECKIYNRLGQIIFQTSSPGIGWDGTHKTSYAELGVYVYEVSFLDGAGKEYDIWGTVTLIR